MLPEHSRGIEIIRIPPEMPQKPSGIIHLHWIHDIISKSKTVKKILFLPVSVLNESNYRVALLIPLQYSVYAQISNESMGFWHYTTLEDHRSAHIALTTESGSLAQREDYRYFRGFRIRRSSETIRGVTQD